MAEQYRRRRYSVILVDFTFASQARQRKANLPVFWSAAPQSRGHIKSNHWLTGAVEVRIETLVTI